MTQGYSYNQVVTALAPGGKFEGFSIATQDEVNDLFKGYFGGLFFSSIDPKFIARTERFINLFGPTQRISDAYIAVFGEYGPQLARPGSGWVGDIFGVQVWSAQPEGEMRYVQSDSQLIPLRPNRPSSFFLNATRIAEPAPWVMLGTAGLVMLGAALVRRRRAAAPADR